MKKTRATDTEKRHNILEKGRFLLADYCDISVGRICTRSTKYNINWPNYEPNVRKKRPKYDNQSSRITKRES